MRSNRLLFVIMLATTVRFAAAETAADGSGVLDDIVITASRSGTSMRDLPFHASVVSREVIDRINARHADELISRAVPDADLQGEDTAQPLTRKATLRGVTDQNMMLILFDGIPVQTPSNNWMNWQILDPRSVERIEVMRGPFSSLYGSGAMGGVMSIVSRTPVKPRETRIEAAYGSDLTREFHMSQGGRFSRWAYFLSGRYHGTEGYVVEQAPAALNVRRDREEVGGFGKLVYSPGEHSSLTLGYLAGSDDYGRGRVLAREKHNDQTGYLRYEGLHAETNVTASAYVGDFHESYQSDKSPAYTTVQYVRHRNQSQTGGSAQATRSFGSLGRVTVGMDGKEARLSESNPYSDSRRTLRADGGQTYLGPFIRDELRLYDDRLVLSLGGRLDWFRNHDGSYQDTTVSGGVPVRFGAREFRAFSPNAGAVWHADENTDLRASVGQAFNAPSIVNLYVKVVRAPSIYGNPDLSAEKLTSYELGAERRLPRGVKAGATFFQSWGSNLITRSVVTRDPLTGAALTGTAVGSTQWSNVAKVEMLGVESRLDWKPDPHWDMSAAYTYLRSKIRENKAAPSSVGGDYLYAPPNKFTAAAAYAHPKLATFYVAGRYKDHMFSSTDHLVMTSSYWTADAAVYRELVKGLTARVDVRNIADNRYDVFDGSSDLAFSVGRTVMASLALEF